VAEATVALALGHMAAMAVSTAAAVALVITASNTTPGVMSHLLQNYPAAMAVGEQSA